jgi:uncharacterized protein (TIGR03083 family)
MPKPTGGQIAQHYLAAHTRLVDLASALTGTEAATPVPATPGWTVRDVLAHLAASPTDVLAGRLTTMPDDEFTAGQIEERRDRSVAELVAEWSGNVEAMAEGARAGLLPPNLAVDALTHEQDIRGALGRGPALTPADLRFCVGQFGFGLRLAIRAAGLPALDLRAADTDFQMVAGDGDPAGSLSAPEFELFRALSGRRGRRQIAAYDWSADPAPWLDHVNVLGPLPDTDVHDG